jgi:hypothetical protein
MMLALGVVLVLAGCAPEARVGFGQAEFESLYERVVVDDGLYVFADRAWRREGTAGGSFRKIGGLLVYIQGDAPDELRVTFRPDDGTDRFHFVANWDGTPIWAEARTAATAPLQAVVSSEDLSAGVHRLRLERVASLDAEEDRSKPRNYFMGVDVEAWRQGTAEPQSIITNPYPTRFLDFGVTGQSSTQLGGCLFLGPQDLELELSSRVERQATFTLQNQSRESARFSVELDDDVVAAVEIEARGERPLRFRVPAGDHTLTLRVDGLEIGSYLWGAPHLGPVDSPHRTPVVIVTLDTTRRDRVPPYSGRPELAPNLTRFAAHATVFENAWATSPWTLPSHASIFTGMYPSHHRAGVLDDVLDGSWTTLAERFRSAGYRTAGFIGGSMASSRFGLAQGFTLYDDPRKTEETADVITDAAVGFIRDFAGSPLLVFVNYFDPHELYAAPEPFRHRTGAIELAEVVAGVDGWGGLAEGDPAAWAAVRDGRVPQTEAGLASLRAEYDAEVAFMDHELGRLFDTLRAVGIYDRALIVLAADHGEYLGERGLYSHSFRLDPELVWIPLLVKWPFQREGATVLQMTSLVDLYPTIAAAAGIEVPASDGLEFSAASTAALEARERIFIEEHESRFHQLEGPAWIADHLVGLQWLDRREVFWPGAIECARRDGGDWIDEACARDWQECLTELDEAMRTAFERDTDFSALDLDEAEAEALRALGYLQ